MTSQAAATPADVIDWCPVTLAGDLDRPAEAGPPGTSGPPFSDARLSRVSLPLVEGALAPSAALPLPDAGVPCSFDGLASGDCCGLAGRPRVAAGIDWGQTTASLALFLAGSVIVGAALFGAWLVAAQLVGGEYATNPPFRNQYLTD